MLDPAQLFELSSSLPDVTGAVLVEAMDGFVDAGRATRLASDQLLSSGESQVVATFDVDQLFDYRARRPEMIYATDHWESYADPKLALYALRDTTGKPFLLLAGPEPDTQWERFVAAVRLIMIRLGTGTEIGLNAIPMGVPHTRPPSIIAHGRPVELVADYTPWLGTVQVPASAGHLLEFRLVEAGLPAMGFAVNVPHYLAHLDYPEAAATLIEHVGRAAGLQLDAESLTESAKSVRSMVDEQVGASEEITATVRALEVQYDEISAGRGDGLIANGGRLPTADEIGAEFERFLSSQPPREE